MTLPLGNAMRLYFAELRSTVMGLKLEEEAWKIVDSAVAGPVDGEMGGLSGI